MHNPHVPIERREARRRFRLGHVLLFLGAVCEMIFWRSCQNPYGSALVWIGSGWGGILLIAAALGLYNSVPKRRTFDD